MHLNKITVCGMLMFTSLAVLLLLPFMDMEVLMWIGGITLIVLIAAAITALAWWKAVGEFLGKFVQDFFWWIATVVLFALFIYALLKGGSGTALMVTGYGAVASLITALGAWAKLWKALWKVVSGKKGLGSAFISWVIAYVLLIQAPVTIPSFDLLHISWAVKAGMAVAIPLMLAGGVAIVYFIFKPTKT